MSRYTLCTPELPVSPLGSPSSVPSLGCLPKRVRFDVTLDDLLDDIDPVASYHSNRAPIGSRELNVFDPVRPLKPTTLNCPRIPRILDPRELVITELYIDLDNLPEGAVQAKFLMGFFARLIRSRFVIGSQVFLELAKGAAERVFPQEEAVHRLVYLLDMISTCETWLDLDGARRAVFGKESSCLTLRIKRGLAGLLNYFDRMAQGVDPLDASCALKG